MNVMEYVNSNQSLLGRDIVEWIMAPKSDKTEEESEITDKLYNKYLVDSDGNSRNKIFPNVYYYVNHNNRFYPNVYLAYIVRDKLKSPRHIPEHLVNTNLVGSPDSYKGSTICEWAYYQNGCAENPYYMEGCEIVTKYLESDHPLKRDVYYYVSSTTRGVRVFRDIEKSPRSSQVEAGE